MMILRDIGVYGTGKYDAPEQIQVGVENQPFDLLFLDLLGKGYRTKHTAKIGMRICPAHVNQLGEYAITKHQARVQLDIVEYWKDFDFESYYKMPREEQKKYYWKMLCDSVMDIAEQLKWEKEPIQSIYQRGLERLSEIP